MIDSNSASDTVEKVVVACPSCRTRFAVRTDVLRDRQECSFHCSRCDHVFHGEAEFDEETGSAQVQLDVAPQVEPESELPPADLAAEPDLEPNEAPTRIRISPELAAMIESAASSIPDDDPEPGPDLRSDVESGGEQKASVAEVIRPELGAKRTGIQQTDLHFPASAGGSSLEDTVIFDNRGTTTSNRESAKRPDQRKRKKRSWSRQHKAETAQEKLLDLDEAGKQAPTAAIPAVMDDVQDGSSSGLLYIVAPVFLFLALLGGFSWVLRSNAEAALAFSAIYGDLPRVAPVGLRLEQTEYRLVELADGANVAVINGKISNGTDETFRELQLEGALFDESGQVLASRRTHALTGLGPNKLELLSLEMLLDLEKREKTLLLHSGDSRTFSLILPDLPAQKPAYFTVRIYSIEGS